MTTSHQTLEVLEQERWGDPEFGSHLVTECHRLRKVPLSQFTIENLRIMIGQGFSLPYLMPLALERLTDNPFAEGDFYPGDLLQAVLKTKWEFWETHPGLFSDLQFIMGRLERQLTFARDKSASSMGSLFPLAPNNSLNPKPLRGSGYLRR